MQKEHPVVATPSSDEDPNAQHSDSDYSLGTDDSPHSVDSFQLSAEDDDDNNTNSNSNSNNNNNNSNNSSINNSSSNNDVLDPDDNAEHEDNRATPPLHKAQTSPATSSTSARDLDGEVDDFFLVELERRSPSPRLVHENQPIQERDEEQEREHEHEHAHEREREHKHEHPPQVLPDERQSTESNPLSSSSELVFPTLALPQSPHASLLPPPPYSEETVLLPEKKGEENGEDEEGGTRTTNTKAETTVPSSQTNVLEGPRTVQLLPPQNDNDDSNSSSSSSSTTTTTTTTITTTTDTSMGEEVADGKKKKHTKQLQRGGVVPPPVHTGALPLASAITTSSSSASADNESTCSNRNNNNNNNNTKENGPERGSPALSSNQSRPRSSSLISGAPRSPRTPKSVAFAPDVKEAPEERSTVASDDAGSSDTSSGDEDGEGKELHPQEYQVLLLGTARNTQDIAKTCTKVRADLRRLSRHTAVKFTTCFDRPIDKGELGEYDLCVYFIQALGAQPQDAELLLDIVQRTATLVIISSHNTTSLSRQVSIDTRRHLGVYLNKAMPRLPLFRNPFRTARLSQDYESDAELILRNAVSLRELPRINIAVLLDSVQRDPTRARFTPSWDWHDRLPSLNSLLFSLLFLICVPYLAYNGLHQLTRPKPPAHALLSNLSYDIKHGFATCTLDLETASGRPYRSKEHHPFAIRVLSTDSHVTIEGSEAFQHRSPGADHHTFPGDNKHVVLVNIRGMGLDACHSDVPNLYLHIWFQNGTRVPGTPMRLALPEEQRNCPTPPPLQPSLLLPPEPVAVTEKDGSSTVWERVQRVVASSVPFSQSPMKTQTTTDNTPNRKVADHSQDHDWPRNDQQKKKPRQPSSKKTDQPRHHQQQQKQKQQRQQQQQQQEQKQQHKAQPEEDDFDFTWAFGGDWATQWGRFSSVVSQQFQNAEVPKHLRLAMYEMVGAFQDMYHFCQSASFALRDLFEDAKENVQHFLHDLCDDTYPIIKQVRRSSHKYKKAVRQQFRCYYNHFKAKFEEPDLDQQLHRMLRTRVESVKKVLEQQLPVGRLADAMDQAVFEANLRAQTLMTGSMKDMPERWKKVRLFEQRLAALEQQMNENPRYSRMDARTRRKYAIEMMVRQGYWVPNVEYRTPPIIQHGKEQWRQFRRRFAI
ncbi:hypothetical protein DFQ27_001102 [Actinomortierella ambigua]|uniref:Uncharacterized protein n=1 Tax=Actinomortierella ambigua TaxID=1343610 RepID=A0A9P6U8X1_9FUNG|nr:hypothetical protein DFQ27_001102 [Actinomortierella ambigua]